MTMHHVRALTAAAFVAPCLLLAACSSATPHAAATHTAAAAADSTNRAIGTNSSAQVSSARSGADTSAAPTQASRSHPASSAPHLTVGSGGSACALVTENDISTAQGSDPGKGSAFSSHGATQCQYGSYATRVVLINVLPSRGAAGFDHLFANPKVGAVALAGLGDRALEHFDAHTDAIYFTEGDTLVFIGISSPTAPPKGLALALAKLAAAHF